MFEVKVQGRFSAAHNLRDYQGDCENLHGHNWLVEVAVTGEPAKDGMVVDFRVLNRALHETLASLDHKYLNELEFFESRNTTTENIAEYVFSQISPVLPGELRMAYVTAWESPGNAVTYRREDNPRAKELKGDKK